MDARGLGQALLAAAAVAQANALANVTVGDELKNTTRGGVYCNRLEECCDTNCWPSLIVSFFLVTFFVLMLLICLCKYCLKSLYEAGWIAGNARGERHGLLLHMSRRDLPPPYHAVVHASYLPSYEEASKVQQLRQV